eukprot:8042679-Pyramimonas_sp.AAC.1
MSRMCRSLISRTSAMRSKPSSAKLDVYIPIPCWHRRATTSGSQSVVGSFAGGAAEASHIGPDGE